ncbi:TPA: autotransporter outer membrane beta-barrel domain-containing protein [Stenotrophomonas maltophilia]|nr:autotransporter outer membrane beta-barrel domain-containing protein [Stenotrophomonas maltophilia]HDS1024093.1 autotransporter outer membrane beta-barrel domain-containing protein [Stenotrophomonas maltophilia]HDS1028412.1 autotransporter outer membrane beta-barrel domain-containing protein [Stenotrophomonas maltophilia]HDS1032856.1 autotransporter outer membrane beta-barrel domain-containing protein [Stenotrophomonas maltophilia]
MAAGAVNATRVNVTTHGYGAAALLADGAGSSIQHDGGTLRSEGSLGNTATPDRKATVTSHDGASIQLNNVLVENLYTNTVSGAEGAIPDVRLGMGILADGGSIAVSNSHIEAEDGATVLERGTLALDNSSITSLGGWGLLAGGEGSTAVMNGGSILVEQSSVTPNTPSSGGRGVSATVGGHVSLNGTAIEVRQLGGNGLETYGAGSVIDMTGGSVLTTADQAWGALAGYGDYVDFVRGGQINFDGTAIETRGKQSAGLFAGYDGAISARNTQVLTSGDGAHGAMLERGNLTLLDSQIHTTGEGAAVIQAAAGSTFSAAGSTLVTDRHTAMLLDNATVALTDGTAIQGGNGTLAEFGSDAANTLSFDRNVVALGDIRFAAGALDSDGNGVLDRTSSLSLDNNSYWNGATDAIGDLSLANGSRWDVTGNSEIGSLSLANSSVVFDHADGQYKTLTVDGNFHADNGLLAMNTTLGDDTSPTDLLHVKGDTSGNANIAVTNIGGTGAQTEDGIKLVQVDGVSAGEYALAGRAVGGAYEYFLYQGGHTAPNDGDWYLRSELSKVDPPVDPCNGSNCSIDPPVTPVPVLRPEAGAYLANQASALGLFNMDLHERVGEPNLAQRQRGDGNLGSAWARVTAEQPRYRVNDQLTGQGRQNVVQIGSDLTFWGKQDRGVVGVMAGSGRATNRITSQLTGYGAEGRVDGKSLGVYSTWIQDAEDDDGLYIDGWLQAAQFKNRVQGDALAREQYRSRSLSASVEAGYALRLHQNETSALYLEPQVQAIWTDYRMDGGQHQEVNGTVVKTAEAGGLQTRVGARLYGHSTAASGNRVQPFVAVNWIRNGSDANAVWLGEQRLQGIVSKNVYEAKAGAQLQLSPNLTGWGEVSVQQGDYGFRSVGGQLGVKYAW